MARGQQLNVKMIERLKEPGKYGDGRNLYLHVTKTGSKSWLFIYRRLGSDRMRGLGSYRNVSLEEAREKAADYRALLRQGIEPPVTRGAVKKKEEHRTFAQLNERYLAEHKDSWRSPDKAESLWRNSLRDHAYRIIGEKDVKDIDVKDVHAVLSPIWLTKHPTAKKIRWRIGAVLAYAAALDLRADVDLTRTEASSTSCYQRPSGFIPSRRMIRSPIRMCQPSWPSFAGGRALQPPRWSS